LLPGSCEKTLLIDKQLRYETRLLLRQMMTLPSLCLPVPGRQSLRSRAIIGGLMPERPAHLLCSQGSSPVLLETVSSRRLDGRAVKTVD
jgi:hypothetical protein